MTSETRTLIQIGDIEGIELECPECRAKVFYPIEKNSERIGIRCPNCNCDWFILGDDPRYRSSVAVEQIKILLRALKLLNTPTDMKATLRLSVAISPGTKS
jgi:hypothetical protein